MIYFFITFFCSIALLFWFKSIVFPDPFFITPEQVLSDMKSDSRSESMIKFASQFTNSETFLTNLQQKPFVGKAIIIKEGALRKDLMHLLTKEFEAKDTFEIGTIILLESKIIYSLIKDTSTNISSTDTIFQEMVKMSYIQNAGKFIYYTHEYYAPVTGKRYSRIKYDFIIYDIIINDMYAVSDTIK